MGRSAAQALPPVDLIQERFEVDDKGALRRRDTGKPITGSFVHIRYEGRIRRLSPARTAWAIAPGEYPRGQVRARNGDDVDFRGDLTRDFH